MNSYLKLKLLLKDVKRSVSIENEEVCKRQTIKVIAQGFKYKSCAKWSDIEYSEDTHDTYRQALSVCDGLKRDYNKFTPCSIRGVCIAAWVETIYPE